MNAPDKWQGRRLKLVSGVMMLAMGLVLVTDPSLLNHLAVTLGMVALAPWSPRAL